MREHFARFLGTLRDRPGFIRLWISDTVSVFGSQITLLALPLTAALVLGASASQMGALVAFAALPAVLFSLHAGATVDRARKLPLIRFTALSRGCLLLLIPVCSCFGWLRVELLYVVGFLMATNAVFADAAYQVLIAKLVRREELVEANAKFALSESSADIAGPGLAGVLVQWLTAPFAIVFDAFAFFVSSWLLGRVELNETQASHRPLGSTLAREIREGVREVWANRTLRWTCLLLTVWQFLKHMFAATFVLLAVRKAQLSAGALGIVFCLGGVGFFAGSIWVERLTRAWGMGRTMLTGIGATALGWTLAALTHGPVDGLAILALALMLEGLGVALFFLNYISLRQGVTREALLGRVICTTRFFAITAAPLGAVLGGLLGEAIGLPQTIFAVGAAGTLLCALATICSPLKQLKELPEPANAPGFNLVPLREG
jgi:MFS family permease